MIIFGTRGVTYKANRAEFFCPVCNAQLPYLHKRVRRFFTLYFIPVIPMDLCGEYIECQQCRNTFQMAVLEHDPGADTARIEAEFQRAVKRVMVLMMLADGVVDPEEITTIREVYGKLAQREITEQEVRDEIDQAGADGLGIEEFLAGLANNLNDVGKELVVRGAFLVAAADGEFQDEERELLARIGGTLGMTSAHLRGVVDSMMSEEAAS